MSSGLKFDNKSRETARRLVVLLESKDAFEANLDAYVKADGQIDDDFLPTLDRLRGLISGDSTELGEALAQVSDPFKEALLEWAVSHRRTDMLEAWLARADRQLGKLIKRVAHSLKTQGIAIEDRRERKAPRPEPPPSQPMPALVSAVDSQGEQVVWLAREIVRGVRTLQAILSPRRGVSKFDMYELSRREYKQMVREITVGGEFFITEAPVDYALYLLRRHAEIGQPPDRYITALSLISSGLETPAADPLLSALAAPDAAARQQALTASDALHDLRPFSHFVPDRAATMRLEIRLHEIQSSKLMLDEKQRAAQISHALDAAMNEYFSGPEGGPVILRIRDMAALLHLLDQPDKRDLALATAELLSRGEIEPSRVPFVQRTFRKIFSRWPLEQPEPEPEPQPDEGNLIVPGR